MVFAARLSKAFITPDEVLELERWSGYGILEALIGIDLEVDVGGFVIVYFIRSLTGGSKHLLALPQRSGKRLGAEMKWPGFAAIDQYNNSGEIGCRDPVENSW
jgi:hypothetical protein